MSTKILFVPPEPWYVERHMEYLIRYFGNQYHMEQGMIAPEPYEDNCRKNPLHKNPDNYDLLIPLLPTHPMIDLKKYGHKTAMILWEPREGGWNQVKTVALTTPLAVKAMENDMASNAPNLPTWVKATPGIDTNLFMPMKQLRPDNKMHVGVICCFHNPRHRIKEIVIPLLGIPGIEFDFYVRNFFPERDNDIVTAGGQDFISHIRDGNKTWPGVANIYNKMDVLLKVDADPGLTFPVMEASACGVPFVATRVGIEEEFANAGAGIVIQGEGDSDSNHRAWLLSHVPETIERIRTALEWFRDHPAERAKMGMSGREYMLEKYTWEKQLPNWQNFFRKALA